MKSGKSWIVDNLNTDPIVSLGYRHEMGWRVWSLLFLCQFGDLFDGFRESLSNEFLALFS